MMFCMNFNSDDVDSSSNHCEREKPGEYDDMLGGMFAFSEEGRDLKP